jgi:pilus assembly protein FimV
VDLDLDFSLGDEPATVQDAALPVAKPPARPAPAPAPVAAAPAPALELPPMEMDFSSPPAAAPKSAPVKLGAAAPGLDSLDFEPVAPAPVAKAAPAAAPAAKADMLEFDLGGLSLDLPGSASEAAAPAPAPAPVAKPATVASPSLNLDTPPAAALETGNDAADADSPLATKLALAEEFNAIGDADGARSLAEEVVAEASGDLKSRAQRLLAEIG